MRGVLGVPQVLGDDIAHAGDFRQLVAYLRDGQIEVLGPDQEDVVVLALPHGSEQARDELEQPPGLLELFVLLEQRHQVLEPRVERIGGGDLVGDRFGAALCRFRFGRFAEFRAVGARDVGYLRVGGQAREEVLAQNVVNFVGGEVDRRDAALLAAELGAGIVERAVDEGASGVVGGGQIRDDDADIALLAGGGEEVREGAGRDVGDGAVAHGLGVEIVEVRRHLVEEDQDRALTVEQLEPVLLVRRLRTRRLEVAECVALAELVGDLAPEEVVRAVAAVEGGDGGALERVDMLGARAVAISERRMFGQQADADEQVRLATSHGLLEVEHGL